MWTTSTVETHSKPHLSGDTRTDSQPFQCSSSVSVMRGPYAIKAKTQASTSLQICVIYRKKSRSTVVVMIDCLGCSRGRQATKRFFVANARPTHLESKHLKTKPSTCAHLTHVYPRHKPHVPDDRRSGIQGTRTPKVLGTRYVHFYTNYNTRLSPWSYWIIRVFTWNLHTHFLSTIHVVGT